MSTIERAAARLGTVGRVRAEPIVREPAAVPDATSIDASADLNATAPTARSEQTIASPRIGGGFCELDIDALTAAGFATQQNVNVEIAANLRRIKRPLLMAIKKSVAVGRSTLPHAGTEASVLARMVGHVVVLVEADKTPQSSVADALHQLKGIESVSMILNKARRRSSDHVAYGYGYGYGSQGS
jgi:hypothetical protein